MERTKTGGGIVIQNGKVLVVSQHGNSWSLPKGHIDPGEDAKQAAVREVEEESGITKLVFHKKLGTYQRHRIGISGEEDTSELKTISMFLFTTPEVDLKPIDPDNPEARWVEPHEVATLLTHPKDKAFFVSVLKEVEDFIKNKTH